MPDFSEVPLLVAFTSFNRYAAQVDRLEDAEVARVWLLATLAPERAGDTTCSGRQ